MIPSGLLGLASSPHQEVVSFSCLLSLFAVLVRCSSNSLLLVVVLVVLFGFSCLLIFFVVLVCLPCWSSLCIVLIVGCRIYKTPIRPNKMRWVFGRKMERSLGGQGIR